MSARTIIVVTACLCLLLGGCYATDKPIITRDIAVEVPGLEGNITDASGKPAVYTFDEQSMSYRAGERQTDGSIDWGPHAILIMPLWDDLYWFQAGPMMHENGQQNFIVALFKFERTARQLSGFYVPHMTKDERHQFAKQYQVTLTEERGRELRAGGSRDDILTFLMAHADVPLKHFKN